MPLSVPFQFANVGLKTPTARLDADFAAVVNWLNAQGHALGALEERPAPTLGQIYVATDQGFLWYLGDGTAWHPIGRAGHGQIDLDPTTGTVRLFDATAGTGAAKVLTLARATGLPTSSPEAAAQWYVTDTQGVAGRAAWHHRSEDGWVNPVHRTLFRLVGNPAVTVSGVDVATPLFSATLQGGTFRAGRSMDLSLTMVGYQNHGGTFTLTIRTTFGGTVLTASETLWGTTAGIWFSQHYRFDAVSDTAQVGCRTLTTYADILTLTTGAVDATVDQPFTVTVQPSAVGSIGISLYALTLELV